ncbi:MAG: ABC transporter ATP-binding protein [Leptolyngbyaceae bacterium]|nr:ABC transporter ATP-binding protein [Leptolyngbyaceae bacterium]
MKKDIALCRQLLPLLKLYPWAIPVIVVLGMLGSIFEGLGISLFVPVLQGLMQDSAATPGGSALIQWIFQLVDDISPQDRLWMLPALILLCILVKNLLSYTNGVLSAWLKCRVSHQLRSRVFHQLLTVSHSYLGTQDSGKLMNTLGGETWRTGEAIATLISLITTFCTTVVYTAILLLISPKLAVLIGVVMGTISLAIRRVTRRIDHLGKRVVESNANLGLRMYEGLVGMKTIRAFGQEPYEQQQFDRSSQQVQRSLLHLDMLSTTVSPLYEVFSALLVLTILVIAVQNDRTVLPTLLTFLFMLYRLQPQMQLFDSYRTKLQSLAGSVEDVLGFLDCQDKTYIHSGTQPFHALQQSIDLKSVSFHYADDQDPALDQVSLTIPAGKITALVGPSGAGKSTLIHLVCRFYDPSKGEVQVDGRSLPSLDLVQWRQHIAIVSQDIHVFNTTIAGNIAYGQMEASRDDIIAAAQQAHIHDFIQTLPQGYDTSVGDRGTRLSGGQRQRLALARAIVRNPDILILDEATNALDSISEHLIQEALDLFSRDRTVIVIAHRLSTVYSADQIVVLHQGQVVEQGNVQQLLQQNGLFSQMYQLQTVTPDHLTSNSSLV